MRTVGANGHPVRRPIAVLQPFALISWGCTPAVELGEAPIRGGTELQQDEVRAELGAFEGWIGRGRLQVEQVRFEPIDALGLGRYARRRIWIDDALDPAEVRGVLRHELCHALDYAEGLSDAFPLLEVLGDRLAASPDPRTMDAEGWRREAFAQACAIAPSTSRYLETTCPGDDVVPAVMAWLGQTVWTETAPPAVAALGPPVVFTFPALSATDPDGEAWTDLFVAETSDPALVSVTVSSAGGWSTGWLVAWASGRASEASAELVAVPRPESLPLAPPLSGMVVPFGVSTADRAGPVLGFLRVTVARITVPDRLLWLDVDRSAWRLVGDGCAPSQGWSFFFTEASAWTADLDGAGVRWSPVGAE